MEWKSYPENKPTESGSYIISITRPYSNGDYTTKYLAYYKPDLDAWFEYDGLTEKVSRKLDLKINAWVDRLGIFIR